MITIPDTGLTNYLNCRGSLLALKPPIVMGILNSTPDSFFDGGKFTQETEMAARVERMILEGARVIDIGGVSTRPGADEITIEEEWSRIRFSLQYVRRTYPDICISIDTTRAEIARRAHMEGADMINDVSGGSADPEMFDIICVTKMPYVLMHMQGSPFTMQHAPTYRDVTAEVVHSLLTRAHQLRSMGAVDIILDPGFGFGKDLSHNFQLLADLELFTESGFPVLVGFSRKSMINKVLKSSPDTALNGTTVLNTIALMKGASILRVHDVKEAVEAIKLVSQLK